MVLKIRLARFGKRHAPFYNIVLAHARTARNSKPLEVLGTYDPIPKTAAAGEHRSSDDLMASTPTAAATSGKGMGHQVRKYKDIKLDVDRAKYWLGVGAHPSEPAWRLFAMAGLLEQKYRPGVIPGATTTNTDSTAKTKSA